MALACYCVCYYHGAWWNIPLTRVFPQAGGRTSGIVFKSMSINIYTGVPGSGKSLKLAQVGLFILYRNRRWKRKTAVYKKGHVIVPGKERKLYSNMKFSAPIEKEFSNHLGYWSDPSELVKLRDIDVLWDEVATYLDSTQWANVPLELKRWLQLHRHYGIEIYGSTQDFPMIDISMRRLVKKAYVVTKLCGSRDISSTKPNVKHPWGLVMCREIDTKSFNEDKEDYKLHLMPHDLVPISKKLCSVFDTTQELKPGKYPPLRHIARECENPGCTYHKVVHI